MIQGHDGPLRGKKSHRGIPGGARAKRRPRRLGMEVLEDRTVPAVIASLNGVTGVLDIALTASGDNASVTSSAGQIDVYDGTTHALFAAPSVQGLTVHGTAAAKQTLALHSDVRLSKPLQVSGLSSTTVDGLYQAPSVDLTSGEIHVSGGTLSSRSIAPGADPGIAPSTGDSGALLLSGGVIDVAPSSRLLAQADGAYKAGPVSLKATDTRSGENAKATAKITVDSAVLRGGDITVDASASTTAVDAKILDSFGANIAVLDVASKATVDIVGTAVVTASGDLALGAHSTMKATATALALSNSGNTAADAAFAKANVVSTALTHVGGAANLTAGGTLAVAASNDTDSITTADGSASGANAGGASIAIAGVTVDTEAYADGNATLSAGDLKVSADSKAHSDATAKATAKAATSNTASTQSTLAASNAKSSDGPITLAAALGVSTFDDKTLAYLATTGLVSAGTSLKVDSKATAASSATADASSAAPGNGKPTGEGVAVAVEHGNSTNRAFIAGSGQVGAPAISVNASTSNGPNSFQAQALSGISKKDSGLEGAAAFNIASTSNEAFLAGGSLVNGKLGDVSLSAKGDVSSTATAKPAPGGAPGSTAKGTGASLAVNILSDTTRAELEDGSTLTNAHNLTLAADGHEAMTTTVEAGTDPTAAGTTFAGFSAAAGISLLNTSTTARVGKGAATSLTGGLSADAGHKAEVANTAGGNSAGSGVIGAAFALTVTNSKTTATLDRDLDAAGDVTLSTHANLISGADAKASARGGRPKSAKTPSNAVDKEAGNQLSLADNQAAAAGVPGTGGAKAPSAQTNNGGATVAGALAIDLVTASTSDAMIAPSRKLKAGGAVILSAGNDTDAHAKADGNTTAASASGVGVGIAVNAVSGESTRAVVGSAATVDAKALALDAHMTPGGDNTNILRAEATSGVGSKETGVAGTLAINVAKLTTEAVVASGANVALHGGDLTLNAADSVSAPASARPGLDPNTAGARGFGVSFALNVIDDGARAEVETAAGVSGGKNTSLSASTSDDISTTAQTGIQATGTAFAGAAAIASLNAPTIARLSAGPSLTASGDVSLTAVHGGSVTTNSGGEAVSTTGTSIGASVSVSIARVDALATIDRDVDTKGALTLQARGGSLSDAIALATSKGGKADDGSSPSTAADNELAGDLAQTDSAGSAVGAQGSGGASAPKSETADGGTAVAGALALDLVLSSKTEATIAPNRQVKAGGAASLSAANDTDAHAKADGSAVSANASGIGVGIAINAATAVSNRAVIGAGSSLTAHDLKLQAAMKSPGDGTHTITAEATSGAGAKKTGVAGALAVNIAKVTTEARIEPTAVVTLTGGNASLSAAEQTAATATAKPLKDGATGEDKGIGISASFNIVEESTRAELADNTAIAGAKDVQLVASSNDTLTTSAESGAQSTGGVGVAASLAVGVLNAKTTTRLGAGSQLHADGSVNLRATHIDNVDDSAGGQGKGTTKAIGAAVAFTYVAADTTATTDRDIDAGGAVSLSADSASHGETKAVASVVGAKDRDGSTPDDGARQTANTEKSAADQKASAAGVQGTGQGTSVPDAKTGNGDSLAVAGAIAIEIVGKSNAAATIPDARTVHAGGPLSLSAHNDLDAHTKADGSATGKATNGVGAGLALSIVPDEKTTATIGKNAQIDAHGVSLIAGMSNANDATHVVGADVVSGASASEKAGAGGLGLAVFLPKTTARIGEATQVHAGGGDVLIDASEKTQSSVTAKPTKDGATGKSLGVGLSFAFDIVESHTVAELADTAAITGAAGVHLNAASDDTLSAVASAGATATGGGNGNGGQGQGQGGGGTAITGSLGAAALTSETEARLGVGSQLVTTGGVSVEASHKDVVSSDAGSEAKGDETAVGVSIAFSYESVATDASTARDIDAGGPVTFAAHNASATSATAKASGSGGQDKKAGGSATGVQDKGVATKGTLDQNTKSAAPGAQGTDPNTKVPDAKNSDNKSVAVAGAIALDLPVKVHSAATIPSNRSIHADGKLTVAADNDVDAQSKADGTAVGQATTGVGVAVAITVAPQVETFGTIGHDAYIEAQGVSVSAVMSPGGDGTNVIGADATSGASASDKAGSGAFAMDIFLEKTHAVVGRGTIITASGGDVSLTASEATTSTVNAVPAVSNGPGGDGGPGSAHGDVIGVGVAVALNIVEIESQAAVEDGVTIIGAHDVALAAHSHDTLHTTATAGGSVGGADSTGIGAEAAISVLLDKTSATIGANGYTEADHDASLVAGHVDTVTTTGDGAGSGNGTALGIAIGLSYVDSQTTAAIGGNLNAGNAVTVDASNATASSTNSYASAKGGKGKSQDTPDDGVDVTGQSQRNLADSYAVDNGGQATDPSVKNPQAKTSTGSIAVAGALALNIVAHSSAVASTADDRFVHAGGPLSVTAESDTDAYAGASGLATEKSETGVGVAVALNIAPSVVTSASVGHNADIQGQGITIAAVMAPVNDQKNFVAAGANAGASAAEDAGAGALGMSLFFNKVEAVAREGSHLDAKGGDVSITADQKTDSVASAFPGKGAGGKTTGVGVTVAIDVVQESTHALLADGATVVGQHDLTVAASSHDSTTALSEAGASASEGDAGAGSAAISIIMADTHAGIGTGADINAGGAVVVDATHTGNGWADVDSKANGADTVVGIAIAFDYLDIGTTADIHRNVSAAGAVSLDAHTQSAGTASAKASASGAKGKDGNSQSDGVDKQATQQRDYANDTMGDNGGQTANTNEDTSAKTSEGGVSVAGALGLNIVHVHSEATIPDGLVIGSGGKLTVSSWNDADASASADGSAVGQSKTGVGVAVAINYVDATGHASVGDDLINSKGLTVEAIQGAGNHQEVYSAHAVSGAGAKNTGVAGGVALNLVKANDHVATIASGAYIDAGDGDVRVAAASETVDTAEALPHDGGAQADDTGVGASVGVNIVLKQVRAEVEDDAVLLNAGKLDVTADSTDTLTTTARNGAQGDEGIGVSAAVLYIKNDTLARVGTGPKLHTTGDATIHASLHDTAVTKTDSAAVGDKTAVGLAISVGIVRTNVDAELARDLESGGGIAVTADASTFSDVDATSSATGIPKQLQGYTKKNSDERTKDQFDFADSQSGQNESSNSPSVANKENDAQGSTQKNVGADSQSSVGVAAAIAVNVELVHIGATVAPDLILTASGPVAVTTSSDVDGKAFAQGLSANISQNDSTTVSAAVAVNVPLVTNNALVGAGTVIHGNGIHVSALQSQGTDDFTVRAISGAAGTSDTGAGSAAVLVTKLHTTALVGPGSTLDSKGDILVAASSPVRLQNIAGGGALGDGNGVGIGIALNLVDEHTTEAAIGAGGTVDALGPIVVSALGSITPITGDLPLDPSSVVVGVAASTDKTVGGSILVDDFNQFTRAEIEQGTHVNATAVGGLDQSVSVTATSELIARDAVGGIAFSGDTGVGAGVLVSVSKIETYATIGKNVTVKAGGDVTVNASNDAELKAVGIAGGVAASDAVAITAVVFVPDFETKARIDDGAHVEVGGSVIVGALQQLDVVLLGGALSVGAGGVGVGAQVATLALTQNTEAHIGAATLITAKGLTSPIDVPTGALDGQGDPAVQPFRGVAVTAVAFEHITTLAIGGAISSSDAVSGSAAVNVLGLTTLADIGHNAIVFASNQTPGSGPSIDVLASDVTALSSTGGALAGGSSAGVGIGVDVGVITKNTQAHDDAYIAKADGDLFVRANSSESVLSFSASLAASGSASVAGAAGVYIVDVTTRAVVGFDPADKNAVAGLRVAYADGNVDVAARESFSLLQIAGNIAASGSVGVGAGVSVPIVTKTTEALVGAGTGVVGRGLGGTMDADTGEFGVVYTNDNKDLQGADPAAHQKDRSLTKDPNVGLPSDRIDKQRKSDFTTKPMKGVAVTAANRDEVRLVGGSVGASGSVAVTVSGAIHVLTNRTVAHIDAGAVVNPTVAPGGPEQSVRIAAGDDFAFSGIAAGASVAGSAAVTAGATVLVVDQTTKAYAEDGTSIRAERDIEVEAHAAEDILTVAAAVSGGGAVAAGGAVSTVIVNNTTYAHIGGGATTDDEGAKAHAGGNVVVYAVDDTTDLTVAGGLSVGGGAGLGGSVGVTVFTKDTQAYVGDHATIDAGGKSGPVSDIIAGTLAADGSFDTLAGFHGLAVQAASAESVFQVSATGAGGFYFGLGGGVTVEVFQANTKAFIGHDSKINTDAANAGPKQGVNVAATDRVKDFSLGGGIGAGVVGIGGGVDVGILRNNTAAFIDENTEVHAAVDVGVFALSVEDISSYGISGSVGLAALAGSVSVWSIGSDFSSTYSDDSNSSNTFVGDDDPQQEDKFQKTTSDGTAVANSFKGVTASYLSPGKNGALAREKKIDGVDQQSGDMIDAHTAGGQVESAAGALSTPVGTSAEVRKGAKLTAGGAVGVRAADKLTLNVADGGVAVGFVGIGAAIAVVDVQSHVTAKIDSDVVVDAGGNVLVTAGFTEELNLFVLAGTAGIAALGAEVVVVHDNSTQDASIAANAHIDRAATVGVLAAANRKIDAETLDIGVGALAVGATYLETGLGGHTFASVGYGARIGQKPGSQVTGNLIVAAASSNDITVKGYAFKAGILAGSGNHSDAVINPMIAAIIAPSVDTTVGGSVVVQAFSIGDAQADLLNATDGGLSATVMIANVDVSPNVTAGIGGDATVHAGGGILVTATHNIDAKGDPTADRAYAHALAPSGSAFSGTGVSTSATANAALTAIVAQGASLTAGGDVSVTAKSHNDASVLAESASVGALGVGVCIANATADGSAKALMDGSIEHADTVKVASTADAHAKAEATAFGIGLAGSAQGGFTTADASPTLEARIGNGAVGSHVLADENVFVTADSTTTAQALGHTTSIGGFVSLGLVQSTATVRPHLTATVGEGSDVTAVLGSIDIAARHDVGGTEGATALAEAPGGFSGLFAGNGATATADSASVATASVAKHATLSTRANVTVESVAVDIAKADAKALTLSGFVAIGTSSATATAHGAPSALMDGKITQALNVTITATGTDAATSNADATSGSLAASGAGAAAHSTSAPTILARVGDDDNEVLLGSASITAKGDITLGAESKSNAEAHGHSVSVGLVGGIGIVDAQALTAPSTTAAVGAFAQLNTTGGSILMSARHDVDQRTAALATAESPAVGGLLAGTGAAPTAVSNPTTQSLIGHRAKLVAKQDLTVLSSSSGIVEAAADSAALGLGVAFGSTNVNASSIGTTKTLSDGTLDGGIVTVTSASIDSVTTDGTSTSVGALDFNGITANSYLHTTTLTQIGEEAASGSIRATQQATVSATAQEISKAQAKAARAGLLASLGQSTAIDIMTSEVGALVYDGSSVVSEGGIGLSANLTLPHIGISAESHAESPGFGLGAAAVGAVSTAVAQPHVYAKAGQRARLNAGDAISVTAGSRTETKADASSLAVGALSIGSTQVYSESSATTEAAHLGKTETGDSLYVSATGRDTATARGEAAVGGLIAGGGTFVQTVVKPTTKATLGTAGDVDSKFTLTHDVGVHAHETASGDSEGGSMALGLAALGLSGATSQVVPVVTAGIADSATVKTLVGDLAVDAKFDGKPTRAVAHATGAGGLAGIQSTTAVTVLTPILGAFAAPNTTLDIGGDATISTDSDAHATSTATGAALSLVVGAGGAGAQTILGGENLAFTNGASYIKTQGDLTIHAKDTTHADSTADALAGGVVGVSGSDAKTVVDRTVIADLDSNGGPVTVLGALKVLAEADENSNATAHGTAVGGISVGISKATAEATTHVTSAIGAGTQVTVVGPAVVNATGKSDVTADADTSAAGIAGVEGTVAHRTGTLDVETHIQPGVSLTAGSIDIGADGTNLAHGTATGQNAGFAGGGEELGFADLYSTTIARVDDATAAAPNTLHGSGGINVHAHGYSGGHTLTIGGAGGAFNVAGAENTFTVHAPLVRASIGNNTNVQTSGELSVIASDKIASDGFGITPMAETQQSSGGGLEIVSARAKALVIDDQDLTVPGEDPYFGELLMADLGKHVVGSVGNLIVHASQDWVDVTAAASAEGIGVAPQPTAVAQADAYTNSIVHIDDATDITAANTVDLRAFGPNTTFTRATADANAIFIPPVPPPPPPAAVATAASEKHSRDCVIVEPGVQFTTVNLTAKAGADPAVDDTYGYLKDAVVHSEGFPIGITDTPGTQTHETCVDFFADIHLSGNGQHKVVIDDSGAISDLQGMQITDAAGQKSLGDRLSGPYAVTTTRTDTPTGVVEIGAVGGETTGRSRITLPGGVSILDASPFDVTLNGLDATAGAMPRIVHTADEGMAGWSFDLTSPSVSILKHNVRGGNLFLAGDIHAPGADTTLETFAGGIAVSPSTRDGKAPVIETRTLSLLAAADSIGDMNNRIQILFDGADSGDAGLRELKARYYVGLDVLARVTPDAKPIDLGHIHVAEGYAELLVHDATDATGRPADVAWHLGDIDTFGGFVTRFGDDRGTSRHNVQLDGPVSSPTNLVFLVVPRGTLTSGGADQVIRGDGIYLEADEVGTPDAPIRVDQRAVVDATPTTGIGLAGLAHRGGYYTASDAGPIYLGSVTAARDVEITAHDTPNPGDDLVSVPGITDIQATDGIAVLRAGDDLRLDQRPYLLGRAGIVLEADVENADPGVGARVVVEGSLGTPSLTITTGPDDDAVALRRLGQGTDARIVTGDGDDAIYLGAMATIFPATDGAVPTRNGGDVQSLLGSITVDAGAGDRGDRLVIEDDGDATGRSVTLDTGLIQGLVPGDSRTETPGPTIGYLNVEALDLLLGTGADLVDVRGIAKTTATSVDAGDGDDAFTVGPIGAPDAGTDPVVLIGGAGANALTGPNADTLWRITGRNAGIVSGPNSFRFLSVQSLTGGTDDDTFALDPEASLDGTVDGGAGRNILDYNAWTAPVTVDFDAHSATGILGALPNGIANIQDAVGPTVTKKKR